MKKYSFLFCLIFIAACNSVAVNNKDANPIPVSIISGMPKKDTTKNETHIFRAMGAGQNQYILKASGDAATTIQYLFISGKPFNDANAHEIDLVLNDENNLTLFTTPLPFNDETFSMPVQFFIKKNEALILKSTTDRFTFWAEGTK